MKKFYLLSFILLFVAVGACSKSPSTYESFKVDSFTIDNKDEYQQANKLLQADYLFDVDISASMDFNSANPSDIYASKRAEFLSGLDDFVNELELQSIDYKIGFISGNINAYRKSELDGRGFFKNILVSSQMSIGSINSALSGLQEIGQTLNANTNVLLESADRVMANKKSSLLRPGSQLVYVFVSDTDDLSDDSAHLNWGHSATSTEDYANKLIAHKGSGSDIAAFVNARAVVAGINPGCTPARDFGEATGYRLAETARRIEEKNRFAATGVSSYVSSTSVSHCLLRASNQFSTLLQNLARDVSKPTNVFQLQVKNVDVQSIEVFKASGPSAPYVFLNDSEWDYVPESNSIRLHTTPSATSRIKITYNQFFVLSQRPNSQKSIKVSLDGNPTLSDASSGWTYNSANNRIEFHGNSIPVGTRIEVQYE